MKLSDLIQGIDQLQVRGDLSREITGLVSNSILVRPGHLFVALKGQNHDGAEYAHEALARGAVALASERFLEGVAHRIPQLVFPSAREGLSTLADRYYDFPGHHLDLIGVTGTNGKTTVCWLVRWLCQLSGFSCGLLGTVRYLVGDRSLPARLTTPSPPELQGFLAGMVRAGSTHAVLEASSHALAQDRLRGLKFKVGVFTNLTRDHLDYHGDFFDYERSKVKLFRDYLDTKEGLAVINFDDPAQDRIVADCPVPIISYGLNQPADLNAERIELSSEGTTFTLRCDSGSYQVKTGLLGRYNVSNILAALGVLQGLGLSLEEVIPKLENIPLIPGRMEPVETIRPFRVLIDFAHTPDALANAIKAVREITSGRVIVVFGCGGDRDKTKRPLMGEIASRLSELAIITSDNPRSEDPDRIIAEIVSGFSGGPGRFLIQPDRKLAIGEAISQAREGDIVLIAGKGHEDHQTIGNSKVPFSDRVVAAAYLKDLEGSKR